MTRETNGRLAAIPADARDKIVPVLAHCEEVNGKACLFEDAPQVLCAGRFVPGRVDGLEPDKLARKIDCRLHWRAILGR
jgi:hypothetical protein